MKLKQELKGLFEEYTDICWDLAVLLNWTNFFPDPMNSYPNISSYRYDVINLFRTVDFNDVIGRGGVIVYFPAVCINSMRPSDTYMRQ